MTSTIDLTPEEEGIVQKLKEEIQYNKEIILKLEREMSNYNKTMKTSAPNYTYETNIEREVKEALPAELKEIINVYAQHDWKVKYDSVVQHMYSILNRWVLLKPKPKHVPIMGNTHYICPSASGMLYNICECVPRREWVNSLTLTAHMLLLTMDICGCGCCERDIGPRGLWHMGTKIQLATHSYWDTYPTDDDDSPDEHSD